jgi:hypothetical protein
MAHKGQRKCKHCGQFFTPDYRNRYHQQYCSAPDCQKVSKTQSHKRWLRTAGKTYFTGPDNVKHVQQWRTEHPQYWRKKGQSSRALQDVCQKKAVEKQHDNPVIVEGALQDVWSLKSPCLFGVISVITGYTLQEDIEKSIQAFLNRGRQILNSHGSERNDSHENKTGIVPTPPAENPRPVQLGGPTSGSG